ncbi:MAG: hypothetical protein WKI04_04665 [Ferruginibacter sp.]
MFFSFTPATGRTGNQYPSFSNGELTANERATDIHPQEVEIILI